jgi:hypothetical protein
MLGINQGGTNPFGRYLLVCVVLCVRSFYMIKFCISSTFSICLVIVTVSCCFFRMFVDALDAQMYDKHHQTGHCILSLHKVSPVSSPVLDNMDFLRIEQSIV